VFLIAVQVVAISWMADSLWAGPPVPAPNPALADRPAILASNVGELFSADSYPAEAIKREEQGRVVAKLFVGANGVVTECRVAASSGSRALDKTTCRYGRKTRFAPARDHQGVAIAGEYKLPVRWVLPRE
jgi:protein TonB